jgi:hypothetical protein
MCRVARGRLRMFGGLTSVLSLLDIFLHVSSIDIDVFAAILAILDVVIHIDNVFASILTIVGLFLDFASGCRRSSQTDCEARVHYSAQYRFLHSVISISSIRKIEIVC